MASTEKKTAEQKTQPTQQNNPSPPTETKEPEPGIKKTQYTVRPGSKMEKAIEVFNSMLDKPRQEVIDKLISEAKLTPSGAKTYFSNLTTRKRKKQI